MPISFESIQDPYGIASSGSILGGLLNQRNVMNREQQFSLDKENRGLERQKLQGTALGKMLEELSGAKSEQDQLAVLGKYGSQIGPENVLEMYRDISKRASESTKSKPKSTLQNKIASQVADTILDIPKITGSRRSLERMRELTGQVQGASGFAKALYGSKEATELNALGLTAIEPILKTLNPVGAIPIGKLR